MSEPDGDPVEWIVFDARGRAMFHISNRATVRPLSCWSEGAERLEATIANWHGSLELPPHVNCNLSLWSSEYYLLAAVASFAVTGNSDSELVLEVGIHRNHTTDEVATVHVELNRECGPPIAAMNDPSTLSLVSSVTELPVLMGKIESFLREHSTAVLRQLNQMEPAALPTAATFHDIDALVTRS